MEQDRFDTLTRLLSRPGTRRAVLARVTKAGVIATLLGATFLRATRSTAARCTSDGCTCKTGTQQSCDDGLVCCPRSQNIPGPGVCQTADACYYGASCFDLGTACASYCGWDAPCSTCCSGYCGAYGQCVDPRCSSAGCACDSGTYGACDAGLSCCPFDPDVYGGPGVCQYQC